MFGSRLLPLCLHQRYACDLLGGSQPGSGNHTLPYQVCTARMHSLPGAVILNCIRRWPGYTRLVLLLILGPGLRLEYRGVIVMASSHHQPRLRPRDQIPPLLDLAQIRVITPLARAPRTRMPSILVIAVISVFSSWRAASLSGQLHSCWDLSMLGWGPCVWT